jgi:uncharacterized protein
LKADRRNSKLLVRTAHIEASADPSEVAPAAVAEIRAWASWLGLKGVKIERKGSFSPVIRRSAMLG